MDWWLGGALLLAVACGSGSKGASPDRADDSGVADTAADDTDSPDEVGCGVETGARPYTVVPLDEGDYANLTPSTDSQAGWTLGETLALSSDLWGDSRPEVVSSGYYNNGYGHAISTTYIFDSEYFSTGPNDGVAQDEARIQFDTENGGAASLPSVIGDIDGDGLDELTLSADGWGASSILLRGDRLASLSGLMERQDLDRYADMTFTGCPVAGYDFANVVNSAYLSDPDRHDPDLVVCCGYDILVAHASGLADGIVDFGEGEQVRISNTDTWNEEPTVGVVQFVKPTVLRDVDGDGLDEVALSSVWTYSSTSETFYEPDQYIFFGGSLDFDNPTSVLDADITFKTPDDVSWGEYGVASFLPVALSDVDGDGVADALWGASQASPDERDDVGIAWFWSGSGLASPMVGDVGDADVTFTADLEYSYVGDSAADVGDVDGDCLSDLLIHSSGYDPEADSHVRPFVHLVRGAELLGGGTYNLDHAGMAFLPESFGSWDGEYVGGQDVDGDAIGDILIGKGDGVNDNVGRIWMIPGGTLPL